MSASPSTRRFRLRSLAVAALFAAPTMPLQAAFQLHDGVPQALAVDYRVGQVLPTNLQLELVEALGATANWNRFGTVHSMVRHGGFIGREYSGTPVEAARAFVMEYRGLFKLSAASVADLEVLNGGVHPGNPGRAGQFRQRFAGLPVTHGGMITVGIVNGRAYYVSSSSAGEQPLPGPATLTAQQAWTLAAADVNRRINPEDVLSIRNLSDSLGWTVMRVAGFAQPQRARLVAMPLPEGGVRQAYETVVLDVQGATVMAYVHFIDAETGKVLRKENRVNQQAAGTTNEPFNGSMPANGSCAARHEFTVASGKATLAAQATLVNAANDTVLNLFFVDPVTGPRLVASADTATSPETINYAPAGGVPAGKYQVEVCMFENAEPLPPTNYFGTFTATESSAPSASAVPFPPSWSWFGSNPKLDFSPDDVRTVGCWVRTDSCVYTLENLAARAPWDVQVSNNQPSFTTIGNAAITAESWASPLTPSSQYRPVSNERKYIFPFTNAWYNAKCDPASIVPGGVDIDAAVASLFAAHNRMHDWSYFLGFTERNYNMQTSNFGLTDTTRENDPEIGNVQAGAQSGSPGTTGLGRDNANQITLQDGTPGITNQYLFQPLGGVFYAPCVDGDFDMGIVGHEYTHAISNRMIGGPDEGVGGHQGTSMGESWGDLAGVEYQLQFGHLPNEDFEPTALGAYATGNIDKGIRDYSLVDNPLNYSNIGFDTPGPEVHSDGEIWNAAQWKLREVLMAKYDSSFPSSDAQRQKDCASGLYAADACPGNRRWIQLIFDAFLLMPANPSMLDARDAMLAADMARFGGANQTEMWRVFAIYGMGKDAFSTDADDVAAIANFESPLEAAATVNFKPTALNEGNGAVAEARLFIGHYAARSRHIADTSAATLVDSSTPLNTRKTLLNGETFKIVPGTYDFTVVAPGYGQHRFTQTIAPGSFDLNVALPTNAASLAKGAAVVTSATVAANLAAKDTVIDESEETGARIGDAGLVAGAHATVRLAGGARMVNRVNVSTAAGPNNPGRFTGVRKFEIRTCNGACADAAADFSTVAFVSADDAFPSFLARPVQPDLIMRSFSFPEVMASHVQLRVLTNQCTGNPLYAGEQDNDPFNATDCATAEPAGDPTDPTAPAPTPPGSVVRLTELQVFGPAPVVSSSSSSSSGGSSTSSSSSSSSSSGGTSSSSSSGSSTSSSSSSSGGSTSSSSSSGSSSSSSSGGSSSSGAVIVAMTPAQPGKSTTVTTSARPEGRFGGGAMGFAAMGMLLGLGLLRRRRSRA